MELKKATVKELNDELEARGVFMRCCCHICKQRPAPSPENLRVGYRMFEGWEIIESGHAVGTGVDVDVVCCVRVPPSHDGQRALQTFRKRMKKLTEALFGKSYPQNVTISGINWVEWARDEWHGQD